MDSIGGSNGCYTASKSDEDEDAEGDFKPSKLGTKEYWDSAYERELQVFRDIGDVGEIWFGEESMERVIRWMEKEKVPQNAAILDIGTGNGVFLVELAKNGFTNLIGIDYSAASVEFSKNILEKEGFSNVKVDQVDFLSCSKELSGFDLCIDKGTFDAISLSPDDALDRKARYAQALRDALRDGGFFVITSCNWTKDQLLHIFSPGFRLHRELPTPCFQFGGRTGSSVTALVLQLTN